MGIRRPLCLLVASLALAAPVAQGEALPDPIPYQRFVLDNGLTLIVHEDHKAPIVAVNVWYHVGSKNERPGKTGFAHLFEHLMFQGSEHSNDEYFKVFDRVGATEINGTTDSDRTNYFQNVPSSALDVALWMESDRMGHLLGVIDQARLDEQRGVVQNEKRQGEDQPYGKLYRVLVESAYPSGHPYSWAPIGSMQDLDAATLEDVREWFRTWYGAANAVIVVAGDVDAQDVLRRVKDNFGAIPPGPPLVRPGPWVAKRTSSQRVVLEDRVPQARLVKAWNVPPVGSADGDRLDAGGVGARRRKDLAPLRPAGAGGADRDGGGSLRLAARDRGTLRRRGDCAAGPGSRPRSNARSTTRSRGFARGRPLARGAGAGQGGGARQLPARHRKSRRPRAASPTCWPRARSSAAARTRIGARSSGDRARAPARCGTPRVAGWTRGSTVIEVRPVPELRAQGPDVDRSRVPKPGAAPEARFPALARTRLRNGLELIVAERRACRWCASSCSSTRASRRTATRPPVWPSWRSSCFPRARSRATASRSPSAWRCWAPSSRPARTSTSR